MECREARELLASYVDGELTGRDALRLDAHLGGCEACRDAHAALVAVRTGVRRHADYFRAPAALVQRIEAALPVAASAGAGTSASATAASSAPRPSAVATPPAVPRPTPTGPTPVSAWRRPRWTWSGWNLGAAVATLAAIVLSASLYNALPRHDDLVADEVVSSHVRALMSNRGVDVASSDQHTVKPWFNGKVDFSPPVVDLTGEGFPLVGGRVDYLDRRPVATLVYRRRQHTIDVYVMPAGDSKDRPAVKRSQQGYHVLEWTRGGMRFWAISDLDAGELESLERMLASR